jgi:type I restriction enzyme S subunit
MEKVRRCRTNYNKRNMNDNQHIPSGYKPSPLGIIPEDWEVKRLGEVCNFLDSQRVPIKDGDRVKMQGKYPYYGASGIIDYVNDYLFDDDLILLGEDGANILTRSTPLAFLVSGKVWVNNHAHVLKTSTNHNRYYICNYLESLSYDKYNTGTAQPKLNREICENIPILLPNIYEQNKIADILQLWDTAIAKQTALIEQLTLRKHGLMQQLLTGKKRLKGIEGEWKEVRLGELFDERNETNCDNLPLLSITGDKGVIYQSESDKRDISNEDKSKYKRICPNDIGYNTMRMWQGRSALSDLEGIVSPAYTIVTPKESVDARFMAMLIQQSRIVYSFWTHSQGLVSDTLNCKYPDFCQVKVVIPSKKEQTAVADFFVEIDKEIELANKKLARLQEEKRGLMQVLLTGKRRINK